MMQVFDARSREKITCKKGGRGGGEEEVLIEEDIYIDLWD